MKFQSAGQTRGTPQLKLEKIHLSIGVFPKSSSAWKAGLPRETWFISQTPWPVAGCNGPHKHLLMMCACIRACCHTIVRLGLLHAFTNAHLQTQPKGRRLEGLCVGLRAQARARRSARGAKCVRLCSATLVRSYSRVCVRARAFLFLHVWRAPSKHLRTLAAVRVRVYTKDLPGKPPKNKIKMS